MQSCYKCVGHTSEIETGEQGNKRVITPQLHSVKLQAGDTKVRYDIKTPIGEGISFSETNGPK